MYTSCGLHRPESSAAVGEVEGPERAAILSARRVRRLEILVQLRKLYRNLIRGDALLAEAAPIYKAGGAHILLSGTYKWHRSDLGLD